MDDKKTKCVACKELIWSDASICPHCKSRQKTSFHRVFLSRLKEFSAITVIFTLIYAVSEFNRFVDTWLEGSNYAERLASTASLLIDAGDLEGADSVLIEARKVHPSSVKVRSIQKELAVINIRSIGIINSKIEAENIRSSLSILHRSLGESDKYDANNLAHIAYASFLLRSYSLRSVNLKKLLDKAILLDESSVYANTFMGYFYLRVNGFGDKNNNGKELKLSDEEKVIKAQQYFDVAIKQNINLNFILRKQMWGLELHSEASFSEFIKVMLAASIDDKRYDFFVKYKDSITDEIAKKFYYAVIKYAGGDKKMLRTMFLSLNVQETNALNSLYDNASSEIKTYPLILQAIKLYEAGNKSLALKIFVRQYIVFKKAGHGFKYRIPELIDKVCSSPKNLDAETITLCDKFFNEILLPEHFSR